MIESAVKDLLSGARLIVIQPGDVLAVSNIGDVVVDTLQSTLAALKAATGAALVVAFTEDVEFSLIRDLRDA